ncbi:glutamate-5-semialdehyde dehydrogenase [Bacillus sp. EB106-08-02-XG196]|jgi:glutamate-5-semialdehyde dehydrogenase|uniref:glutamate-5-semialdehyde dehydrogenase n=1 Tax=Bacillus sp. EB106-08-02-XG196 TaxID=2737049 RepID=UPI0015C4A4DD|nr:glutamate-5-semialdehyde dehydrogenase [Bacillus sp. EB106-08-02-XG196]NWQ41715.1 glutamate-5-semialdehyde dehydrogenase [Bacillus sp. EB106-08-02-XG196]
MHLLNEKLTVEAQAIQAKKAGKVLSLLSTEDKNQALYTLAERLETEFALILHGNEKDLQVGREKGFSEAYMDRLALSKKRIFDFSNGLRQVAALDDPTGKILLNQRLDNGLSVSKVSVPLGVIGMIYEARPNVTADATGLALKSGNAIILKGGSSAINSNKAIVDVMQRALNHTKVPKEAVQFIDSTEREISQQLFTMREHIDVLIPRGGGSLIKEVVTNASVPVLETGVGNCHLYIDSEADAEMALSVLVNAKTDRPAVCNAIETVIIHREWLKKHKEDLINTLSSQTITVHGDEETLSEIPNAALANEDDWQNEYLSLHIAMKVVQHVDEAIEHIERYGTKHSESIITDNSETANYFLQHVDAAALYHNASTRFTDGAALGFGAEIGISTQKLHARGPMGLEALTTVKYVMSGNGQIR